MNELDINKSTGPNNLGNLLNKNLAKALKIGHTNFSNLNIQKNLP